MSRISFQALAALHLLLASVGCRQSLEAHDCLANPPKEQGQAVCTVPGWENRDFILQIPKAFDGTKKLPVVFALHGGGGRKEGFNAITCAGGDESSPTCLVQAANERGFLLVFPDGTEKNLNLRTWNAGGDAPGLVCLYACEQKVDDIQYFRTLVEHVKKIIPIDEGRIFFTGFSDGASMGNRLACEMSDVIAAVAPVGGANQFALSHECSPKRPIPMMQIHGKADPCWPYGGGMGSCPAQPEGSYADVLASMIGNADKPGWALRNGCDIASASLESLADAADDGMQSTRQTFGQCNADVEHIAIEGGGHTWPGGEQYLSKATIGGVTSDFSATTKIFDFFEAHPMP